MKTTASIAYRSVRIPLSRGPGRVEALERRVLMAAGDLDPTFGDGGVVRAPNVAGLATAVLAQGDGKVIVAGIVDVVGGNFGMRRYNANGTIDRTFGRDGMVVTGHDRVIAPVAVALAPGGKVVVVGEPRSDSASAPDFLIERYTGAGALDPTFSGDGRATVSFPDFNRATSVTVGADGKITAAGTRSPQALGGPRDAAAFRFRADGSADSTFGTGGRVVTDLGGDDGFADLALQPDGRIVAAGATPAAGSGGAFAAVRYNSNGTLDRSFSGDGKAFIEFAAGPAGALNVAVRGGKIVLGGNVGRIEGSSDFAVVRLNADGSLDRSFSGDGRQTASFGSTGDQADEMGFTADGRIVLGGTTFQGPAGGRRTFAFARFLSDGRLDTSFSGDGKVVVQHASTFGGEIAHGMAVLGDGRVYAAGTDATGAFAAFNLIRLTASGSLDRGFGAAGRAVNDPTVQSIDAVVVQGDGKVVVGGTAGDFGLPKDFYLARYNRDGSRDTSFGRAGHVVTDFGSNESVLSLALAPGGKIVAAGRAGATNLTGDFAVARYNADGSLDTSFSGDGRVLTNLGGRDIAYDVAVTSDGKVIAAGSAILGDARGDFQIAAVRYTAGGSLDTSFSGDGKALFGLARGAEGRAVALQRDGKILLGGLSNGVEGFDYDFAVLRLNASGSIDTGFGAGGVAVTDFGYDNESVINDLVVQSDGRIVAAGTASFDEPSQDYIALARYNANGSADTTFGSGGATTLRGSELNDARGSSVAVQSDGKILVGGKAELLNFFESAAVLARYNRDGTLDTSFASGGMALDIPLENNVVSAEFALGPQGPVVAASNPTEGYVLARHRLADGGASARLWPGGTLVVNGTGGDDAITLSLSGNTLSVTLNGTRRTFSNSAIEDVLVYTGAGNDTVIASGTTRPVRMSGGDGNDRLIGGNAGDFLVGGAGNDVLSGNGGDDVIHAGPGRDQLRGHAGNDLLLAGGDGAVDFIDGGSGTGDRATKDDDDFAQYVESFI